DADLLRGTPCFMSPEQCRGDPVDERSDIYSLGATYFALLTGAPPYGEAGPVGTLLAHCLQPGPHPRAGPADVPAAGGAIIARAMAKEPADRYAHAAEYLADLESLLRSRPVRRTASGLRPWRLVVLAGLVIGAGLAITRVATWHTPDEPAVTPPVVNPVT